jgi:hypothetical protein
VTEPVYPTADFSQLFSEMGVAQSTSVEPEPQSDEEADAAES